MLNNSTGSPRLQVDSPVHELKDYIEMGVTTVLFVAGGLTNGRVVLEWLRKRRRSLASSASGVTNVRARRHRALLCHLLVSNVLMLLVYCPTRVFWLVTFEWVLGDTLCRLSHVLSLFVFSLCSNGVALIAIDRALFVWWLCSPQLTQPMAPTMRLHRPSTTAGRCASVGQPTRTNSIGNSFLSQGRFGSASLTPNEAPAAGSGTMTVVLLTGAWLMAAICALPQALTFGTLRMPLRTADYIQCSTAWNRVFLMQVLVDNDIVPAETVLSARPAITRLLTDFQYDLYHMLVVFWVPYGVIVTSYLLVVVRLYVASRRAKRSTRRQRSFAAVEGGSSAHDTTLVGSYHTTAALRPLQPIDETLDDADMTERRSTLSNTPVFGPKRARLSKEYGRPKTSTSDFLPAFRRQLRVKMFRTATRLVLCYCLFWFAYNTSGIVGVFSRSWRTAVDQHVNWLKCIIVLNAVVNPFIYQLPHRTT